MHFSFLDPILNYFNGDGLVILPQMELLLFALGILIFDFLLEKREKYLNAALALIGVAASGLGLYRQFVNYQHVRTSQVGPPVLIGFHNSVIVDGFSLVFGIIFLAATALVILLSIRYLNIEREQEGEYYALLLFSCIGMMFMASGIDLIVLFLGLETMALSFYAMVGFLRREKRSNEAAMKYFLLGAFSTGILAYGFSLLYGLSSSTNIGEIRNILAIRFQYTVTHGITDWLVIMAFVTVAAGMFFKVAAVPFHQWAPDVYEGAPTPISAYVSVASKTASFAMFLRLVINVFGGSQTTNVFGNSQTTWVYIISGVAIASLTWGNLAALTQTNMKRLLAYSSISHVGYVLLGLVAWNETGLVGIMYYLIAYAFMTIGAFAVVIVMRQRGLIGDELDDLDGLYQRSPAAALLLAIFAALYIVPALYYYFRVVVHAWMKKPGEAPAPHMSSAQAVALGAALFVTLAAGIYPEP